MRLTILGSGEAFHGSGCNAAAMLDERILVDCGAPVHVLARRAGFDIEDLRLVLVTHFHADHTFMLPTLLGARAVLTDSPKPLTIAGPVGTREYLIRLMRTGFGRAFTDLVEERLAPRWVVLQDGASTDLEGYSVRSHAMVHSTGPSLGYAVTGEGVTVGVTGDTTDCPGLHRLAGSVDALLCECSGWDGPVEGGHLWREQVTELVTAYPQTRFVLYHMPRRGNIPGAIVGHDLLSLDVR